MIANIYNLTGLTNDQLYLHNLHAGKFIKDLTVQNLHDLFFLLRLEITGEPTAAVTIKYLTEQAIKQNIQIY
jgi:hypothetical protein